MISPLFALHTHLTVPIVNTNRFYIRDNILEVCLEGDCLNSGQTLGDFYHFGLGWWFGLAVTLSQYVPYIF
jgi:hypothetical protein